MADSEKSNQDCYFFYYSTCAKGDGCPFRHCEAALGTEVVCMQWKAGLCQRQNCKFRHMECRKKRSNILCYWESQPGGCRKPHCVFMHMRPREAMEDLVEKGSDVIFPVNIEGGESTTEKQGPETMVDETGAAASPRIEPVVVCFDEESDTESNFGTPVKIVPEALANGRSGISLRRSPRKVAVSVDRSDHEFHIKTLEEIRQKRPLELDSEPAIPSCVGTEECDLRSILKKKKLKVYNEYNACDAENVADMNAVAEMNNPDTRAKQQSLKLEMAKENVKDASEVKILTREEILQRRNKSQRKTSNENSSGTSATKLRARLDLKIRDTLTSGRKLAAASSENQHIGIKTLAEIRAERIAKPKLIEDETDKSANVKEEHLGKREVLDSSASSPRKKIKITKFTTEIGNIQRKPLSRQKIDNETQMDMSIENQNSNSATTVSDDNVERLSDNSTSLLGEKISQKDIGKIRIRGKTPSASSIPKCREPSVDDLDLFLDEGGEYPSDGIAGDVKEDELLLELDEVINS